MQLKEITHAYLIEQHTKKGLRYQRDNPDNETALYSSSFQEGQWIFEGDYHDPGEHSENLDDRKLDDNRDEE